MTRPVARRTSPMWLRIRDLAPAPAPGDTPWLALAAVLIIVGLAVVAVGR